MKAVEMVSGDSEQQYAAVVRAADGLVIGLDFDGTLAPIVDDPASARIHPRALSVLPDLAEQVHTIAVITGRPARQAVALGDLAEVGSSLEAHGRELIVLGQYGSERWTSHDPRVISPPPPPSLSALMADLPRLLRVADAADAWVEEKGLAVAVHTRRMSDPVAAFDRLLPVLDAAATRFGLQVEPGRAVIEIRDARMDKGIAVHELASSLGARAFVFIGDDLGDVQAFSAVRDLGIPRFLVCSGSSEESALRELADAVVPGPDGVMDFLAELADEIRHSRV